MATLWEMLAEDHVLRPRSVRLEDSVPGATYQSFCADIDAFNGTSYGILDGQQRCTALAMVFGGLRTQYHARRTTGRFFADLKKEPDEPFVIFKKEKAVVDEGLGSVAGALGVGLLPLEVMPDEKNQWNFTRAWTPHLEMIADSGIYQKTSPDDAEIELRKERLTNLLSSVGDVQLAVLTVDSSYQLADICEIFETLNQTGTKVSTVDLIHSFVLADSSKEGDTMNVRDWLKDLDSLSGAKGWSPRNHPERVAQAVTASYLGLSGDKPDPRPVGGKSSPVSSIKGPDLLRTPTEHWLTIRDREDLFAGTFGLFQDYVAEAGFPLSWCPYAPGSLGVFFGLAWSWQVEEIKEEEGWDLDDLKVLFQAFFWRNALSGRYDQGFLTQSATDLGTLRGLLKQRSDENSQIGWIERIIPEFDAMFGDTHKPSRDELRDMLVHDTTGARRLAILLAVQTRLQKDLITQESIAYPEVEPEDIHKHHIWPKRWIKDHRMGELKQILDEADQHGWKRVDCPANLMPLSAKTNEEWKASNPGAVLEKHDIEFNDSTRELFSRAFIDEDAFDLLRGGDPDSVGKFQDIRGGLIADYLDALMVPSTY